MAQVSDKRQASSKQSSYEQVKELIKPALNDRARGGLGLNRVVGSHGTQIDSIQRLAIKGTFSGGAEDLHGNFHLTPNMRYKSWPGTPFSADIDEIMKWYNGDSIEASVAYSEMSPAKELRGEVSDTNSQPITGSGVVITFNKLALRAIRQVDRDDLLNLPEIVLHEAPAIEAIRAIYPVDQEAAQALQAALPDLG